MTIFDAENHSSKSFNFGSGLKFPFHHSQICIQGVLKYIMHIFEFITQKRGLSKTLIESLNYIVQSAKILLVYPKFKYTILSHSEIVKDVTKKILRWKNNSNKIMLCRGGRQYYLILNKISMFNLNFLDLFTISTWIK